MMNHSALKMFWSTWFIRNRAVCVKSAVQSLMSCARTVRNE